MGEFTPGPPLDVSFLTEKSYFGFPKNLSRRCGTRRPCVVKEFVLTSVDIDSTCLSNYTTEPTVEPLRQLMNDYVATYVSKPTTWALQFEARVIHKHARKRRQPYSLVELVTSQGAFCVSAGQRIIIVPNAGSSAGGVQYQRADALKEGDNDVIVVALSNTFGPMFSGMLVKHRFLKHSSPTNT